MCQNKSSLHQLIPKCHLCKRHWKLWSMMRTLNFKCHQTPLIRTCLLFLLLLWITVVFSKLVSPLTQCKDIGLTHRADARYIFLDWFTIDMEPAHNRSSRWVNIYWIEYRLKNMRPWKSEIHIYISSSTATVEFFFSFYTLQCMNTSMLNPIYAWLRSLTFFSFTSQWMWVINWIKCNVVEPNTGSSKLWAL